MVRSAVTVLALAILPGFAAVQQPAETASRTHQVVVGETLWALAQQYYTESQTASARIVSVEGPVFKTGIAVHLDRKMR